MTISADPCHAVMPLMTSSVPSRRRTEYITNETGPGQSEMPCLPLYIACPRRGGANLESRRCGIRRPILWTFCVPTPSRAHVVLGSDATHIFSASWRRGAVRSSLSGSARGRGFRGASAGYVSRVAEALTWKKNQSCHCCQWRWIVVLAG